MKKWVLFTIHGHQVLCERLDLPEHEIEEDGVESFLLVRICFDGMSADLKLGYHSQQSRDDFFDNQDELYLKAQSVFEGTAGMLGINYVKEQ